MENTILFFSLTINFAFLTVIAIVLLQNYIQKSIAKAIGNSFELSIKKSTEAIATSTAESIKKWTKENEARLKELAVKVKD